MLNTKGMKKKNPHNKMEKEELNITNLSNNDHMPSTELLLKFTY